MTMDGPTECPQRLEEEEEEGDVQHEAENGLFYSHTAASPPPTTTTTTTTTYTTTERFHWGRYYRLGCFGIVLLVVVLSFHITVVSVTADASSSASPSGGESSSSSSPRKTWRREGDNNKPPSVVILPGPHKTGTTSTQICMVDWVVEGRKKYLDGWSWPLPSPDEIEMLNLKPVGRGTKGFGPLVRALRAEHEMMPNSTLADANKPFNASLAIDVYRTVIWDSWKDGKNIVFGTEEMDRMVSGQSEWADRVVMDGILDMLPSAAAAENGGGHDVDHRPFDMQDDVEVVVNYRTPRVSHLKSVWHQIEAVVEELHGTSFRHFLLKRSVTFHVTNSLQLALEFLRRDLKTTIIHLSGMQEEGRDICHVVACDVMKANCTQGGYLTEVARDMDNTIKSPQNARADPASGLGLTDTQMTRIDEVMRLYDCGLKSALLEYESTSQLQVLFRHDFLQDCPSGAHEQSFEWMINHIHKVILEEEEHQP